MDIIAPARFEQEAQALESKLPRILPRSSRRIRSERHSQLKSVLEMRPVLPQSHLRIETLLFLYFLALMTEALMERGIRNNNLYIFTHREFKEGVAGRMAAMLAAYPDEEINRARAEEIGFLTSNPVFKQAAFKPAAV